MFGRIHLWSNPVLDFWVFWKFLNHNFNFSTCDWFVHVFFLFPLSVFKDFTFLRICPFFLSCPFYWHIFASSRLLMIFISMVTVITYFSWFNYFYLIPLPFFPNVSGKRFISIVDPLKEPALILIILSIVFVIFGDFEDSHSDRCEVISYCGFDLHPPDD